MRETSRSFPFFLGCVARRLSSASGEARDPDGTDRPSSPRCQTARAASDEPVGSASMTPAAAFASLLTLCGDSPNLSPRLAHVLFHVTNSLPSQLELRPATSGFCRDVAAKRRRSSDPRHTHAKSHRLLRAHSRRAKLRRMLPNVLLAARRLVLQRLLLPGDAPPGDRAATSRADAGRLRAAVCVPVAF